MLTLDCILGVVLPMKLTFRFPRATASRDPMKFTLLLAPETWRLEETNTYPS